MLKRELIIGKGEERGHHEKQKEYEAYLSDIMEDPERFLCFFGVAFLSLFSTSAISNFHQRELTA